MSYDSGFKEAVVVKGTKFISEAFGLINGMGMDAKGDPGNRGDSVNVTGYDRRTAEDMVESFTIQDGESSVNESVNVALDYHKKASFDVTGTEWSQNNLSYSFENSLKDCIRACVYDVTAKAHALNYKIPYFAGKTGQSFFNDGTNPSFDSAIAAATVLDGNLVDAYSRSMILSSTEAGNYKKISGVQNRNQAGIGLDTRITGILGNDQGFDMKLDQQVPTTTAAGSIGTSLAAKAATVVAATAKTFTATGVGAIVLKKGDIITIAGVGQFAQQEDVSFTDTDGTITLDRALGTALAGGEAITITTNWGVGSQNIAGDLAGFYIFNRLNRLTLDGLDQAKMVLPITHESGLSMLFTQYGGESKAKWQVSLMYGINVVQSELLCRCLGV